MIGDKRMTGPQVDLFSARLARELSSLSWQDRNDLLVRIGRMDLRMRQAGQERPIWKGPASEADMLGADVVVPTEQGERRGRVICFGIAPSPGSIDYERSVVVLVPSSGTHHEAPGSVTRLALPEDTERMLGELEMARRLQAANEGVEVPRPAARPQRRRGERDPKLVERMLEAARQSVNVRSIEEGSSNHKVTGVDPTKRIYIFKTQLRVDLSGFTLDHPGVRRISDEEARDMHLGKVRGQVLFEDKAAAYDGLVAALELLK